MKYLLSASLTVHTVYRFYQHLHTSSFGQNAVCVGVFYILSELLALCGLIIVRALLSVKSSSEALRYGSMARIVRDLIVSPGQRHVYLQSV